MGIDRIRLVLGSLLLFSVACDGGGNSGNGSKMHDVDAGADGSVALIPCVGDPDCPSGTPYCEAASKVCVACLGSENCAGGSLCDTTTHACVACLSHGDCTPNLPYCDESTHSCVECVGDGNCGGNAPHCDLTTHACSECAQATDCAPGEVCQMGTCDCPEGMRQCSGQCSDTMTDEANCGGCGDACRVGEQCLAGVCHPPCTGSGDCAAQLPYCDAASMLCVECLGDGNCAGNPGGGKCDPATHSCVQCLANADCGAGNLTCNAGRCECPNGQSLCGSTCIDTQADPNHCGTCNNVCDSFFEAGCVGGQCACAAGLTECGGTCRDLANDPNHCGTSCGNADQCSNSEICSQGACTCRPGLIRCGDSCVDPDSNPLHCGGCSVGANHQCQMGEACQAGSCISGGCSGATPDSCVNNNRTSCTNFDTDPLHCGECNKKCERSQLCVAGECMDYASATPCNSCPCAAACNALMGNDAACCSGLANGSSPICVEGGSCPSP